MIRSLKYAFAVLVISGSLSCNRVKDRAERITDKAKLKVKQEIAEQTGRVIDKVFPPFDHDNPDTDNNKKRFQDFLKVEITSDITEIYCFDDAVGIDADYMFSFRCSPETSEKIIKVHGLVIDSTDSDNGFGMQHNFDWWDKKRISQLDRYSWSDGEGYHKYYWYDHDNENAYFFEFDM